MRIVLLLALLLASSARAQAGANGITAEARAAVTLFQTYCLPAASDFGNVNKRANHAGLKLLADHTVSRCSLQAVSRAWRRWIFELAHFGH